MKIIKHLALLLFCLFFFKPNAQELDINWSEMQVYDNKKDGFFDSFLGANSKYIYAKFSNLAYKAKKQNQNFRIALLDKKTMKKVGEGVVYDFKNPASAEKYKGLRYHKTLIYENSVFVFWLKESKDKDELYVQSFDDKMKPQNSLKKIYELNAGKDNVKKPELFVMGNKENEEKILIGGELASGANQDVKLEYKLLNKDFSFSSSNQVTLPIKITGKSNSLTSTYKFGDDGNLHIKTYVSMSKEERKAAKKGESTVFPIYSVVNLGSGQIQSYTIKFENKNIFDFDFVVNKNNIKIFGFFCDLIKDPRGSDTHGIFYGLIDSKTFQTQSMDFTVFTKAQLDNLFAKDIEDRKDRTRSKKKAKSEDESIASNYSIEAVQSVDNDNIVLFCSRMNNYSTRTCDSKGNCTTSYWCAKSNVTAFKINKDGTIAWASNLDRAITYSGWYIYDISVINKNGMFYVVYGSSYGIDATSKKRSSRKSSKYISDRFEYATFDYASGKFTKKEYKVNKEGIKKEEKKSVHATAIQVIDNTFYATSTVNSYKPGPTALACLGALACPPSIIFTFSNPNIRKGTGYLGRLGPLK